MSGNDVSIFRDVLVGNVLPIDLCLRVPHTRKSKFFLQTAWPCRQLALVSYLLPRPQTWAHLKEQFHDNLEVRWDLDSTIHFQNPDLPFLKPRL
jgi:hypothetical protein